MTNTVGLELNGVLGATDTRIGAQISFRSYF
jgi:hypothetical protein